LDRALAPAIGYAENGFPVSDVLAEAIGEEGERLAHDDEATQLFGPRGRWARAGEMLQQPDLAASLRAVARDGADVFYRGDLGERFATAIAGIGGAIDRADLAAHRTDRPEPLSIGYRGLRVFGQPPVSQGHILLEELAIVEGIDVRSLEWGSADLVHLMVETKKLAFADRDAHAGDPARVDFDARRLLDAELVATRRRAVSAKASERSEAGSLMTPADTTYLAVVDRDGNAVSLIESVFSAFGMDVQQAIEEPRWFHESGRTLKMERRYPEAVRRAVAAKGHEVAVLGDWAEITGGAQAIAIEPNGSFAGGADPRREGQAAG